MENLFQTLMSMHETTFALGQLTWRKVTLARQVTWCCTAGNPPLEVAPGKRITHVNSYRRQTAQRGKVYHGVSELPGGNELSRDHVNRPLIRESVFISLFQGIIDVFINTDT